MDGSGLGQETQEFHLPTDQAQTHSGVEPESKFRDTNNVNIDYHLGLSKARKVDPNFNSGRNY